MVIIQTEMQNFLYYCSPYVTIVLWSSPIIGSPTLVVNATIFLQSLLSNIQDPGLCRFASSKIAAAYLLKARWNPSYSALQKSQCQWSLKLRLLSRMGVC
jgi:hypothetical protein